MTLIKVFILVIIAMSGAGEVSREDLQRAIVAFELQVSHRFYYEVYHLLIIKCQRNMVQAIATEEDYAIEYDESVACDVCKEVRLCCLMTCLYLMIWHVEGW